MKYLMLFGFVVLCYSSGLSQDKKIDQLEILYDQGYYNKVLRKSAKLIAHPEYDYSALPSFYKALSLFRMSQNESWYSRHQNATEEAIALYGEFQESAKAEAYIEAHYHEISSLKAYLVDLEMQLKKLRYNEAVEKIQNFRLNTLKNIRVQPDYKKETEKKEDIAKQENGKSGDRELTFREKLVVYAKSLIGIKYVWAGCDKNGFDCSGFIGYVHKKYGIVIPRTASAQKSGSKKLAIKEVQKGDLVFFGSGNNISHVGLVVTDKGKDIAMVHASTSKGVIVTEIEKSTYWKPKLKGAGSFI